MHVLLCMHSLPFNNLSLLLTSPKNKDQLRLPHSLVTSDIANNWKKKIISAEIVKPAEPGLEMKAEFWNAVLNIQAVLSTNTLRPFPHLQPLFLCGLGSCVQALALFGS